MAKHLFGFFERPVGAAADVKEFEYISAIHQSSTHLNTDGFISAADVRVFLRSRFGLVLTRDDAIDIVKGLSGSNRLPLPETEKRFAFLTKKKKKRPNTVNDDDHTQLRGNLGSVREEVVEMEYNDMDDSSRKKGILRNPFRKSTRSSLRSMRSVSTLGDDDDLDANGTEDEAKHHLNLLENVSNLRREWHFKREAPKQKKLPKNVEKLVKYDLVELLSFLYIPTLVRMERFRFSPPKQEKPPLPPQLDGSFWQLSSMAWYVFKLPFIGIHEWRRKRLVAMKALLRPKPDALLEDVLRIMLGNLQEEDEPISDALLKRMYGGAGTVTTQGTYFPKVCKIPVTETLVRRLLTKNGEKVAARDDDLVREMVRLVGGEGSMLDERSFAHALVADVGAWPLECEDDVSTSFFDVYGFEEDACNQKADIVDPEDLIKPAMKEDAWAPSTFAEHHAMEHDLPPHRDSFLSGDSFHSARSIIDESSRSLGPTEGSVGRRDSIQGLEEGVLKTKRGGKIPQQKRTLSYIDYGADSFQSILFVVFLFCFYVLAAVYIVQALSVTGLTTFTCDQEFTCVLLQTVWSWLTFAITLSIAGIIIIVPISVGNNQYTKSFWPAVFSMAVLGCYTLAPWVEFYLVNVVGIKVSDEWQNLSKSVYYRGILALLTFMSSLTALMLLRNIIAVLVPRRLVRRFFLLRVLLMPYSMLRTAAQKRAATNKLNRVIENAHKLHRRAHKKCSGSNAEHATILSFVVYGEKLIGCGGFLSVWGQLLMRKLSRHEGVWIHVRLFIGQVGQIMLGGLLGVIGHFSIQSAVDSVTRIREDAIERDDVATQYVLYITPTRDAIVYSLYPGGAITCVFLLLLVCVYFPSTVATILKFRSGVNPSLHDPNFARFRGKADYVYYNTGNMIYAFVGSAVLFFILFGGLLFLCFWEPTRLAMLNIIAWGIGLTVTIVLKMVLTGFCRSTSIKAFFRTRPGAANLSSIMLECWHLGLAGGVLLGRVTQFLLAMAFWVGRIDSYFLSDDVQVFGYRFDTVPHKFISEILVHDAHRHPYVERMAALYLMRLRYGEHFCSDAGAAWRRLFIATLFPWMLKYRDGYDDDVEDSIDGDTDEQFPLEDIPTEKSKKNTIFPSLGMPGMRKKPEPKSEVRISGIGSFLNGNSSHSSSMHSNSVFSSTQGLR